MSRLLSEKRIIAVDTTAGTAGAEDYNAGAVVVDTAASAVYVSDGADWTEVVLGSDIAVSSDISAAADNDTVAGSLAAKTYIDDEINGLSIPTLIPTIFSGYPTAGIAASGAHEMGAISANAPLLSGRIMAADLVCEVYNYTNTDITITDADGNGIVDVAFNRTAGTIEILAGQKITFINNRGTNVAAFRSSI